MPSIQKISPCLWFADQAEDAARFYTSIFKNSKIERIARYGKAGQEIPRPKVEAQAAELIDHAPRYELISTSCVIWLIFFDRSFI